MAKFPWPKSMRWGSGDFQWVRPLQSILCLLDGKVVKFEVAGIASGKETRGHRFHGNEQFAVESFADYAKQLKKHKVMLDPAERAAAISEQAHALAKEAKLSLVEDEALAGRERRPHRMAECVHGRVRQGVPRRPRRVPDDER